ncbi:MAG: hypothetical protein ACD_46C00587G0001, partial [uncultured bacterium]
WRRGSGPGDARGEICQTKTGCIEIFKQRLEHPAEQQNLGRSSRYCHIV